MMITDPNVARLQVADRTRRFEAQADASRARRDARRELGLTTRTRITRPARIRQWFADRSTPVSAPPAHPAASTRAC